MEIVNNILKTIIRCLTIVILVSIIFTFFTFSISEDGFKIDNKFPDNYSIRIDGGQLRINGIPRIGHFFGGTKSSGTMSNGRLYFLALYLTL